MSDVNSMAVIGAGTMGAGIALSAATNGIKAYQVDVDQSQLERQVAAAMRRRAA